MDREKVVFECGEVEVQERKHGADKFVVVLGKRGEHASEEETVCVNGTRCPDALVELTEFLGRGRERCSVT
jgi:hypothetical protein